MYSTKTYDLSFLHTDEVHIKTFQGLINELAPNLKVNHTVNEPLLMHAQAFGEDDTLLTRVRKSLLELTKESTLTICTCSSIGSAAESIAKKHKANIIRIDRAMADQAVKYPRILVLAALKSTLKPTRSLLEASAKNEKQRPEIRYQIVEKAWTYFLAGDTDTYHTLIKDSIEANASNYDAVMLAQASMASAASLASAHPETANSLI